MLTSKDWKIRFVVIVELPKIHVLLAKQWYTVHRQW